MGHARRPQPQSRPISAATTCVTTRAQNRRVYLIYFSSYTSYTSHATALPFSLSSFYLSQPSSRRLHLKTRSTTLTSVWP